MCHERGAVSYTRLFTTPVSHVRNYATGMKVYVTSADLLEYWSVLASR